MPILPGVCDGASSPGVRNGALVEPPSLRLTIREGGQLASLEGDARLQAHEGRFQSLKKLLR